MKEQRTRRSEKGRFGVSSIGPMTSTDLHIRVVSSDDMYHVLVPMMSFEKRTFPKEKGVRKIPVGTYQKSVGGR